MPIRFTKSAALATGFLLCVMATAPEGSHAQRRPGTVTQKQRVRKQAPKKLVGGKVPRVGHVRRGQLRPPPEPSVKQAIRHRLGPRISAAEFRQMREDLVKNASPQARAQADWAREQVRKHKLTFEVGVTAVSDKDLKQITGWLPPTAEQLAELPEQLANSAEIERQFVATARTGQRAALGPVVSSAGVAAVGASYYSESATGAPAAAWMDPATYPLPAVCDPAGSAWVSRDALPRAHDQGTSCGSCWAFAAVGALEVSQAYLNGAFYDFSEQSILDCATDSLGNDAGSCRGGWYPDVFNFARSQGPAAESVAPYQFAESTCAPDKLTAYTDVTYGRVESTIDAIKAAICAYGSVAATINATNLFKSLWSGVFSEPAASSDIANHAIVLVGWDDARAAWLLRNSWGTSWGEAGFGWVAYGTNGVGQNAWWVRASPGDGGSSGAGSPLGAFYTRDLTIRNSTNESITLLVQYQGWTGSEGLAWLPQQGYWYTYKSIAAGAVTKLGSPFVGSLRARKALLYAKNSAETKQWATYQATPLDLVPDGGYWAAAPEDFEVEFTPTAVLPRTTIAGQQATPTQRVGECSKWSISRIQFNASTSYSWDPFSAPDVYLELTASAGTQLSPLSSDDYTKVWDFVASAPLLLAVGESFTLSAYDRDLAYDDFMGSIVGVVPNTFSSGVMTIAGEYGTADFTGTCAETAIANNPPALADVMLASSVKHPAKIYFAGNATDDVGLKAVAMTVSGPKGSNFTAFNDTAVTGMSKSLTGYFFDSANTTYAGVAGSYTVVLSATDTAGLVAKKTFTVALNIPPSVSGATLATFVKRPAKIYFAGNATDDVGLKTVAMTVSGPKGSNLTAFNDTAVTGTSKALTGYFFDSANTTYAGVAGSYTVVLSAKDSAGLIAKKTFTVALNIPPSVSSATLAPSVKRPAKVSFTGSATDDVGLRAVSMTVSGPKGSNLTAFNDTAVTGTSKSLTGYFFDSANTTYAGVAGSYTAVLSAKDSAGLIAKKTFAVTVY